MVPSFLCGYAVVPICVVLAVGLALVLLVLPFLISPRSPDAEKLSAYECGFPSFSQPGQKFSVQYYLIAILFVVFDLEFALLLPWVLMEDGLHGTPFWCAFLFLVILGLGFVYEWRRGALEWR